MADPLTAQVTAPPLVQNAPHGTLAGWFMGCRCMWCQAAKRANTLLVIEGDDSWSITGQGQDLPAHGVRVPNDVMYLLANRIVALSNRQVGDPGD